MPAAAEATDLPPIAAERSGTTSGEGDGQPRLGEEMKR
jgi:hypothetical protein